MSVSALRCTGIASNYYRPLTASSLRGPSPFMGASRIQARSPAGPILRGPLPFMAPSRMQARSLARSLARSVTGPGSLPTKKWGATAVAMDSVRRSRFSTSSRSESALGFQVAHKQLAPVRGEEQFHVFAVTNEGKQKEAQEKYRTTSLRGNGFFGCSGLCALNFASLKEGIEQIHMFDINPKVGLFWQDMGKIISSDNANRTKTIERIFTYLEHDETTQAGFYYELEDGLTFLNTEERLARIRAIFRRKGHFSFTQMDMCNTKEYSTWIQSLHDRGIKPDAMYIANIASCLLTGDHGAVQDQSHLAKHPKYWDFKKSLAAIPADTIVIDAREELIDGAYTRHCNQRVHETAGTRALLMAPPCPCLYTEELMNDDYDKVLECLRNGANPSFPSKEGITMLMTAAAHNKNNSMRALLDFMKERHAGNIPNFVNAREKMQGHTALHCAALVGNVHGIQLLIEYGADVHLRTSHGKLPLHLAAQKNYVPAIRVLLRKMEERTAQPKTPGAIPRPLQHPAHPVSP